MSADHQKNSGVRDTFLRTVAVLGLLAVLILGAWGIILLASYLPTVFYADTNEEIDSSDNSVVVIPDDSEPTVVPIQPSTPTRPIYTQPTYTNQPSATYVAAPQRAALYGSPDLGVYINSVAPQGNRISMQFTVQNVGTNIASGGWMFNALLPWYPNSYTYASPSQQALYPGDKIVYTLSFDRYNGSYRSSSNDRYEEEKYDDCDDNDSREDWHQNDWLDWYDEYVDDSDDYEDWERNDWEDWYYDDYCDDYDDRNDDDDYRSINERVSVTADPQGRVYESNRSNNTANASI
ncbi:hypothetical protein H7X87_00095 [Acetobacteraceae bacterium]|nr:hypothetical protein [Candidatus Parcubacteria bacterium]